MLITLLAWLYISFVCRIWGAGITYCIKKISGNDQPADLPFSITCLLGFAGVTIFASILSLFIPLGGWVIQVIILLPCILFLFQKQKKYFFADLTNQFSGLHPSLIFLFLSSTMLILVMSSWTINHPDTLGYHAQTIQWIEEYKAVPGLVHLNTRYGYQGLWFVSCAIFSFKFAGSNGLTFINSAILAWYFIFIIQKIDENIFRKNNKANGFLWIALATLSFWSYTQVRLTATSASPDFIAALLVWTIFFLLLEKNINNRPGTRWMSIILFCFFAVTIKLSVIPVLIIAGYAAFKLIQLRKVKQLIVCGMMAAFILFPFVARNIITSGYLIFPSTHPDIVHVDWKFDKTLTQLEKDFITAYARTPVNDAREKTGSIVAMKLNEWLPVWWKNRSWADQALIVLLVLSFVVALLLLKKITRSDQRMKIALLTLITGIVFWFVQAPDPRFGFGFIVVFPGIIAGLLPAKFSTAPGIYAEKILIVTTFILGLAIGGYTLYRFMNFFTPKQMIQPLGITRTSFKMIQCNGVIFNIPGNGNPCGCIAVPCAEDSCKHLELRGTKIEDGFRAK